MNNRLEKIRSRSQRLMNAAGCYDGYATIAELDRAELLEMLAAETARADEAEVVAGDLLVLLNLETARADRYKSALESIVGQTSDQFYEGIWREVNYTAQAALEDKP